MIGFYMGVRRPLSKHLSSEVGSNGKGTSRMARPKGRPFKHFDGGQRRRLQVDPADVENAKRAFATKRPLKQLVRLSTHCLDRYRDRFSPEGSHGEVKQELYSRLSDGGFSLSPPSWLVSSNKTAIGFIIIDDDIALPLRIDRPRIKQPFVAVTTLYRIFDPAEGRSRDLASK